MKLSDRIFRFLVSFMCGSALAIGNLFCIITAFDIPVDTDLLILLCISASLLFSGAFIFKRAWIGVSAIAFFAIVVAAYNRPSVVYGFILMARSIAERFIASYDSLSGITLMIAVPAGTMATSAMAILGAVLALLTVSTVSKRYSLVPLAVVSLAHLSICMLITTSMPDVWAFALLAGTYVLLIMTQSGRRHSENGGYSMTFVMALPVMLFIAIIIMAVQPKTYVRSDDMLDLRKEFKTMMERYAIFQRDEVTGQVEFISPIVEETLGFVSWNEDLNETDLSRIGPQGKTGIPVMSVYSHDGGKYYLKGNSFGVYEDNTWKALNEAEYEGIPIGEGLWTTDAAAWETVQIRTDRRSSILYLPYIPTSLPEYSEIYYDSYILNSENLIEYNIQLAKNASSAEINAEYEEFVHQVYTQVPDETREALSELTQQLAEKAWMEYDRTAMDVVAEYVQESAAYDLNTPQMPDGEDFAAWFLQESDTGYCVHFATAATVLLRCMDIPARYVTGYLVNAESGQWTTVTQDDAHAWVEFYTDGYGWRKLEPTPGMREEEIQPEQDEPVIEDEKPEPPAPVPGISGDDGEAAPLTFVWVLLAMGVVALIWCPAIRIGRALILKKGTYNERVVKYYRRIRFLCKLDGELLLPEVEELAMKARFSQHSLTKDELVVIINAYRELCGKLRKEKKLHLYVLYHFILALPKA